MPNTDKSRPDRKLWIVDDKILVALTTTKIYFNVINRLTNVHTDTQIELFIISIWYYATDDQGSSFPGVSCVCVCLCSTYISQFEKFFFR